MKLPKKAKDLTNQEFVRLKAIKPISKDKQKNIVWLCKCICGNTKNVSSINLIHGRVKSCGCIRREFFSKEPNKFFIYGDIAAIILTNNNDCISGITLIDTEDLYNVISYRWSFTNTNGYIHAYDKITKKFVLMHRIIMKYKNLENLEIDHKNHNKWDNRKSELRVCTHQENMHNRKNHKNNISFKGVQYIKEEKFMAQITYKNETIFLGYHKSAYEAAQAYNAGAKKFFGKFACLNKI